MENIDIADPLFRKAVEAIDAGDAAGLQRLFDLEPGLAGRRLDRPAEGYFREPYLLWFVADNPVRRGRLTPNIVAITRLIITAVDRGAPGSRQQQLDYALGLVATGRIPRECGVQAGLIDMLIDAGAAPGDGIGALAHGNPEAAWQLIARGGEMRLAAAAGLGLEEEMDRLEKGADEKERLLAVTVAAFYGRTDVVGRLIAGPGTGKGPQGAGINLDTFPDKESGFHWHATALHQAVSSGSLDTVRLLTEAGAGTSLRDLVYQGTPLGWAEHMVAENQSSQEEKEKYERIADYLRGRG